MRTTGSVVKGDHWRRCVAYVGCAGALDVSSVTAPSCCTGAVLTLKCRRRR